MNTLSLEGYMTIADTHAKRLRDAFNHIQSLIPMTQKSWDALSYEDFSSMDVAVFRFSKLQDVINSKIFILILEANKEDVHAMSFIDRINLLEKREFLPDANHWSAIRDIRNAIAHEYPDHPSANIEVLNKILAEITWLLDYWTNLRAQLETRVLLREITKV